MSRQTLLLLTLTFSLFTLISCGKGFSEEDSALSLRQEEQSSEHLKSTLKSLNQKYGTYTGYVGLSIIANQFWARIKLWGPVNRVEHAQYLHKGDRCPAMSDDLNRDGVLDFQEVYAVAGDIILPFDANVNSQMRGFNEFPRIRSSGHYYYSESGNYQWILEDLRGDDLYPEDIMVKLGNEPLRLERRIIVIYGISEDIRLPLTVQTLPGYGNHSMIPIACGEFVQGIPSEFGSET